MFNEDQVQRIKKLLLKQLKDELSPSEEAELYAWSKSSGIRSEFIREITDEHALDEKLRLFTQIPEKNVQEDKKVWDVIAAGKDPAKGPVKPFALWKYAAASALLLAAALYFIPFGEKNRKDLPVYVEARHDIAPGGDKAVLTLSGGKRIVLDSAHVGYLASQGNTIISKDENGQLVYKAAEEGPAATEPEWSTITTPKGGQYRLILPDSTRVWLNSASSVTFPAAFTGAEREVEITGECYFEVAHDPDKPFKLNIADRMQVEVLGTSFNVMAYPEEGVLATTLLDGSLQVRARKQSAAGMKYKTQGTKLLKPGQQARMPTTGNDTRPDLKVIDLAHPEEVIAWKNGLLSFRNADIRFIMRQISRWYDLEVIYNGDIPSRHYSGNITREVRLTEALEVLHLVSGAWFEIRGREVTVEFPGQ